MSALLQGLVIGFSIAAPVGPIGLLCLRRSLADGRLAGFVSGLGAATADAVYGIVAALGLSALTSAFVDHHVWLQLGGGVFLVGLGAATVRSPPAPDAAPPRATASRSAAFASTFLLTLANPMTILAFVGIFAGLGAGAPAGGPAGAAALVLGVFLGSAAWWLLLSMLASWFGARLRPGGLRAVNILSGLILASFGLWQLATLAPLAALALPGVASDRP